jgi:hypothetical protein
MRPWAAHSRPWGAGPALGGADASASSPVLTETALPDAQAGNGALAADEDGGLTAQAAADTLTAAFGISPATTAAIAAIGPAALRVFGATVGQGTSEAASLLPALLNGLSTGRTDTTRVSLGSGDGRSPLFVLPPPPRPFFATAFLRGQAPRPTIYRRC